MNDLFTRESLILGGILGGLAFILTFMAGLFGGVAFGSLILQSFLFTILFFIIGIGAGIFLKKMIPDLWELGDQNTNVVNDNVINEEVITENKNSGSNIDYTVGSETELSHSFDNSDRFSNENKEINISGISDDELNKNDRKVDIETKSEFKPRVEGEYIIVDDKKLPNKPEDYAKAVRTMLSKDK